MVADEDLPGPSCRSTTGSAQRGGIGRGHGRGKGVSTIRPSTAAATAVSSLSEDDAQESSDASGEEEELGYSCKQEFLLTIVPTGYNASGASNGICNKSSNGVYYKCTNCC